MEKAGAQAVLLAGFWKEENFWSEFTDDRELERKHALDSAIGYSVHIPAFLLEDDERDTVKKYAKKSMDSW